MIKVGGFAACLSFHIKNATEEPGNTTEHNSSCITSFEQGKTVI